MHNRWQEFNRAIKWQLNWWIGEQNYSQKSENFGDLVQEKITKISEHWRSKSVTKIGEKLITNFGEIFDDSQ